MTISTVLIGTPGGVVTSKLVGGFTERIRVPPSPGTLQQIAQVTGGEYFTVRTSALPAFADVTRGSTPEEMRERMAADVKKWAAVIDKAGIEKQ